MRARIAAARFLLGMTSVPPTTLARRGHVRAHGERLHALRYGEGDGPLVLVLHGLSPRGVEDPRMNRVCCALASAGCRVLAPELPDTLRLRIGTSDPDRVKALVEPAQGEPPVGVFAASFSASMALVAVAECPGIVRGVCVVGAAGDVHGTVRHLLDSPGADPYGRVLLFRNFAADPAIHPTLDRWLAEDVLGDRRSGYDAERARLPKETGALVDDIVAGGPRAAARARLLLAGAAPVLDALDVIPRARRVRAHVALLHGADDRVIPPSESVRLAALLPRSHLCVTPLLTHGDTRLSPGDLRAVLPLFRAFEGWFTALAHA